MTFSVGFGCCGFGFCDDGGVCDTGVLDCCNNEKVIDVESDFKQGYFFFKISNPIFEEVVFKDKNKLVTSKKDKNHHGIGVANIMRVVSKYNGNTEIWIEDQHFILDINLMLNISKHE